MFYGTSVLKGKPAMIPGDPQLAAVYSRLGRIEQLINVVLENQKHQAVKMEYRLQRAFDTVKLQVEAGHDEVCAAVYDALERIPNNCVLLPVAARWTPAEESQSERLSEEQKEKLLRAVVESLDYEQARRDKIASEHGWPIHPRDVEDVTPEQQREMFDAFTLRQPPPDFVYAVLAKQ